MLSLARRKFFILGVLLLPIFILPSLLNISWGSPYFFHPDERNIAFAVTRISIAESLDPHFFAYGTLPIYTTYFIGVLQNILTPPQTAPITSVSFEQAVLIGRSISTTLFYLSLILIYLICKKAGNNLVAITGVFLSATSVGLLQYARFSTFEMWLTFFSLLLFVTLITYIKKRQSHTLYLLSFLLGVLISIKISSIIFAPICILIIVIANRESLRKNYLARMLSWTRETLFCISIMTMTVIVTSPFYLLNFQEFKGAIQYESGVATGTIPVFYTQFFNNTTPILYQLTKVYPFILNPLILILSFILIPITSLLLSRKKSLYFGLSLVFILVYFLSQAFLFVKWTRYYIPTLPFIYICLSLSIGYILTKYKNKTSIYGALFSIALISLVYAISFIKTVVINTDTRVEAGIWAEKNIPRNSPILSEIYDIGIIPFNALSDRIVLFNFYDLEFLPQLEDELSMHLRSTDYIIVPSQRITDSRISLQNIYPKGNFFYTKTLTNSASYKLLYQTPCDLYCRILYLNNPLFSYEQTANVFDRPTVKVYKKIK